MKGDNMKTVIRVEYILSKDDYKIIKAALKEKKITIKSVIKELGTTKALFYAQVNGKNPVSLELFKFINTLDVKLTFEGVH